MGGQTGIMAPMSGDVPPFPRCRVDKGMSVILPLSPGGSRPSSADDVAPVARNGRVAYVFIARKPGEPMVAVTEVHAVTGRGLEGDRYFHRAGTWSGRRGSGTDVTLVELEVLEALERDYGIILNPQDLRRNIVTRGISLNDFVGREFHVGRVILRGVGLCEPCAHLERATQRGVVRALVHRGGLRAQILATGMIRVGDVIRERLADEHRTMLEHGSPWAQSGTCGS